MPKFVTRENPVCQASSNMFSSGAFWTRPLAKQTAGFQELARVV